MWSKSKIVYFGLIGAVGLAILGLWIPARLQESDDFWASLAYPVLNLQQAVSTKLKIYQERFCGSTHLDLQRIIIQLNDEIGELQARNLALMAERQYWQEVREVVEFGQQYNSLGQHLGKIFFRSLKPQEQYYLINVGSNDGIKLDMVAVCQNCLVGKVSAVYPQYCKVILLTDRNCKVAACGAQSGAVGICHGLNSPDQLALEYVSHLQNLVEGDQLLSTGEGELFPQGFGLGTVVSFEVDGMYYRVSVKPNLDFAKLKYCYLINPNKS